MVMKHYMNGFYVLCSNDQIEAVLWFCMPQSESIETFHYS